MSAVHQMHSPVGRMASDHPNIVRAGRLGWLAKGVVYIVAGVLAINIALQAIGWNTPTGGGPDGSQEASPTGAIKTVAGTTGGTILLWLLAAGMLLYAAWRLVSALLPGTNDADTWAHRTGYVVSAVLYGSLGVTAISLATADSSAAAQSTDGNTQVSSLSADLMAHTGGRLLVGAVGLVLIGVGAYRIRKATKLDVDDELDLGDMSPERRRLTRRIGALGEAGRGLAFGVIGVFLLRAAFTYDADEATGLDGALRRLATTSWGTLVVLLVGLGFLAYGVFCATTFRHRRLESP